MAAAPLRFPLHGYGERAAGRGHGTARRVQCGLEPFGTGAGRSTTHALEVLPAAHGQAGRGAQRLSAAMQGADRHWAGNSEGAEGARLFGNGVKFNI